MTTYSVVTPGFQMTTPKKEELEAPSEPVTNPETVVRTCLNCGKKLEERKCKLFCECGYYASCSDFY